MGTEVGTVFGGNVEMPKASDLAKALKRSASNDPRGGAAGDADYLNFSGKTGRYTYGMDGTELEKGRAFVPNIAGFEEGWVCWKGGRPVATRLMNIHEGSVDAPDMDEFGPFDTSNGEGWSAAKAMMLKDVDNGKQLYFKNNSKSGVSAMAQLFGMIGDRAERGEGAWPVMELGMSEFTSRSYKNSKPEFNILGWLDDVNVARLFSEEEVDLDELFAASEGNQIPSEGKAEEAEDEQPTRRRRRSL